MGTCDNMFTDNISACLADQNAVDKILPLITAEHDERRFSQHLCPCMDMHKWNYEENQVLCSALGQHCPQVWPALSSGI